MAAGNYETTNLKCKLIRVKYQKDLFVICECETKDDIPDEAANISGFQYYDRPRSFTALGNGLPTIPGTTIMVSGDWERDPKYKQLQLRVKDCVDYMGESRDDIVAYLRSNALKGIGEKTANAIYDRFGASCIDILATDPNRFLEVPGIKEKRLKKLVESYEKNKALHMLTRLLAPHDVSFNAIVRIFKTLGPQAASIVKSNPYTLCLVRGFGFMKADEIAMKMGVSRHDQARIAGAIAFVLGEAQSGEGHLYLSRSDLALRCCSTKILNAADTPMEDKVVVMDVDPVIEKLLTSGALKSVSLDGEPNDTTMQRIYTKDAYIHETLVAEKIPQMLKRAPQTPQNLLQMVKDAQDELGVTLDEKQEEAVVNSLTSAVSIITGGPGTGKTTTLNVLVTVREKLDKNNEGILLAAPTGRAARRMSEQTKRPASTLHSLLGLKPDSVTDFTCEPCEDEMVFAAMLVVDESSMLDAHMMAELMHRLTAGTQLVLVGDADQLPSVGPGNVLRQLLGVAEIKHVKLEKIFRQDERSVIPVNSQRVKNGKRHLNYQTPYFKLRACETEADGLRAIMAMFSSSKVQGMLEDIQILCPMKNKGETCTHTINEALHDIVNPPSSSKVEAMIGTTKFRVGDKVMQTKNIDGAANGDIGYIKEIVPMVDNDRDTFSMSVQFGADAPALSYDYTGAFDLEPATAITIHKSQGSEFPFVVIPVFRSMSFFLKRNVLYTAITRAKMQVVLVGDEKAIQTAIGKEDTSKRNTVLALLIQQNIMRAAAAPSLLDF